MKRTAKKRPMSVDEFLKSLRHKPKWVGEDIGGVILVQFREFKGFSPSLEFYAKLEENGVQRIYFEILDLNGYKEMDFIPLDSDRRKEVLHRGMTTDQKIFDYARELGYKDVFSTPGEIASKIDESLKLLYSGKLN